MNNQHVGSRYCFCFVLSFLRMHSTLCRWLYHTKAYLGDCSVKQLQELFLPQDGILIIALQLYQYPFSPREESCTVRVKCFSNQIAQMCDLIQRARVVKLPNSQISERAKGRLPLSKAIQTFIFLYLKINSLKYELQRMFCNFSRPQEILLFQDKITAIVECVGKGNRALCTRSL